MKCKFKSLWLGFGLSLFLGLCVNAAGLSAISLSSGSLDRTFDTNRTFYTVSLPSDALQPIITYTEQNGYTAVLNNTSNIASANAADRTASIVVTNMISGEKVRYRILFDVLQTNTVDIEKTDIIDIGKVAIKGSSAEPSLNLMVLKPIAPKSTVSYELSSVTDGDMSGTIADLVQISKNGNSFDFVYNFKSSDTSGMYRFYFGGTSVANPVPRTIYYASSADVETALGEFKSGTDISVALSSDNVNILSLDLTDYNKLESKEMVSTAVLGKDFNTIALLQNALYKAIGTSIINEAAKDEISTYLKKYANVLQLNLDNYNALKNSISVDEMLFAEKAVNTDELLENFYSAVAVVGINEAEPLSIRAIVEENLQYLLTSEFATKYNSIKTNDQKINSFLADIRFGDFASLEAFRTVANDSLTELTKQSGGGSGGGGGSVGSNVPVIVREITANAIIPAPIVLTPSIKEKEIALFTDLETVTWAKDAIKGLQEAGVLNGKAEGVFAPNDSISREEFVKIIVDGLGIGKDYLSANKFEDVSGNAWFAPYIYSAYEKGIVKGINKTSFGVGAIITREDMCVILNNAVRYLAVNLSSTKLKEPFADDNDISAYAQNSVYVLYHADVIRGMGENRFEPLANVSRAMAAKLVFEIRGRLPRNEGSK